jgi:hypothetical protein
MRRPDHLADVDIGPLVGVEPDRLLADPALRFAVAPAEAAARALAYAHATDARSYDEIGARLAAAIPSTDVAPLQTVPGARRDRTRAERTRADPRVQRAMHEQTQLRHRPIDLAAAGSYRYRFDGKLIHFTRVWSDGSGGERTDDWSFPLTAPPPVLLDGAVAQDAARLAAQLLRVRVPAAHWLPLSTVIRSASFPRMQDCRADLVQDMRPGFFYCFVSHRWLTPVAPDPDGRQARFTAWQLVAHLCEAVRVAALRGLHTPRLGHPRWGFVVGPAGSELAESFVVNVLRHALDEDRLRMAFDEVETVAADTADHGVEQARHDVGLHRLTALLAERPMVRSLVDRIRVWYDYSCLPQAPREPADELLFRQGLEHLQACQMLGRTVLLLDDAEDYLSRAWCTLEALVADSTTGDADLLIGSERPQNSGRGIELFLTNLMLDRPHIAWRAVLDTEVFRIQTPAECLARLALTATDPGDLPFIYRRLRELRAPTRVHTDGSELSTGVFPVPVTGEGAVVIPVSTSHALHGPMDPEPSSLDWTGALNLDSAWGDGHDAANFPPLQRLGVAGGGHVAVLGASEGEAVLFTAWVLDHRDELEAVIGTAVGSVSWIASDIAAVGEMSCGTLRAEPIKAPLWVLVGASMRLGHGVVAPAIRNALVYAGVPHVEVSIDRAENGVIRTGPGARSAAAGDAPKAKELPAGTPLPVHPGGLLRAVLAQELA